MRISAAQIRYFEQNAMRECELFVREFLTQEAAEIVAALPKEVFGRRVRIGIDRAMTYEIGDFGDIATFVYFMFTIGADFDEYSLFQSILTDADVDPDDRVSTLVELASDDDWAAARDASAPGAWERAGQ